MVIQWEVGNFQCFSRKIACELGLIGTRFDDRPKTAGTLSVCIPQCEKMLPDFLTALHIDFFHESVNV